MAEALEEDFSGAPPIELSMDEFTPSTLAEPTRAERTPSERGGPPPLEMSPDEFAESPGTSTRYGAALRGAAEGVIPGVAGMAGGLLAGAGTGALLGTSVGPWGTAAGSLVGGVIGGVGAGYLGSTAQEWMLDKLGVREGEGAFSQRQKQADIAQFPYSRAAGEMLPTAMTLRPGGKLIERGIGGVIGGGAEALQDYTQTGHVDPYKVAMGAGVGAALPNINKPFAGAVSRVAPQSWRPHMPGYEPPPPPEPPPPAPPEPPPPRQLALPAPTPPEREQFPLPYEVTPAPPRMAQLPSPERVAAVDSLNRQIETARINREQHQPGDMIGLHDQWNAHYDSLVERRDAMLHGKADAGTEASQGLGGPVPTRRQMDQFNDGEQAASGNALVNRPPPERPNIGMGEAAAGNKPVADGAVDESKTAVRTAPGEPTVPSTRVVEGNVSPEIALAAKAAQPEVTPARAAPPAAPPPAAPAVQPPAATAARPAAPPPAATAPRPAPAPPRPAPAPRPAPEPRPTAVDTATVTPAPVRAERTPADIANAALQAHNGNVEAAAKALAGHEHPVVQAAHAMLMKARQTSAAQAAIRGERPEPKPAVEPVKPQPFSHLRRKGPPADILQRIERMHVDEGPTKEPVTPIAQRPKLGMPGAKKETVPQALARAGKQLLTKPEEGGSIDIGPDTRRLTEVNRGPGARVLSGKYAPQALRPDEIAKAMLGAAEGDPRHALILMNRKMNERRGWALRRDVLEARDILHEQAMAFEPKAESRPVPSPEVPVVPGKTRADLQPKPPKPEVREKPYAAPGERTQMVFTDEGKVRKPITFRDEPKPPPTHGLANYTPEEKLAFGEAIKDLTEGKQLEAMALTKAVPKEKVLANINDIPKLLEQERAGRTEASRKTVTGAGAENKQYKEHREGILAAHKAAFEANPRPMDRNETMQEAVARAKKMVDQSNEGINKFIAEATQRQPKFAHVYTGALDVSKMKNPPPSAKVLHEARKLVKNRTNPQKQKFDTEEILALAPETEQTQMKGGLTEGITETVTPEAERLAGPRYEAKKYPDSPTLTSDHADLVNTLNNMSDKAHDMMQGAWGEDIATEVRRTDNPQKLKADLIGALIDAQDKRNKYAYALPDETFVKSTPVSTRAGIARVEQTGRFKPTKPTDFQNLTEAERKAAPVRGIEQVTIDTYKQIKAAVEEFFGKKAPKKIPRTDYVSKSGERAAAIVHDVQGSLDVTKIFDWIDKYAKKFRPDREPMVPTGMTRLYKEGSEPWTIKAAAPNPTKYVDVPTDVVEQYRVDGLPGTTGNAAKRFSKRWSEEIAVPPDSPDRRVRVDPEDAGFVDHLRRLWADEDGALDVSRMPAWIPTAGAKLRNMFARGAAPATQEYHDQLAARQSAIAMGDKIALDWNVKLRRDTVDTLGKADKLLRNATYEDGKVPAQAAADLMRSSYEKNNLDALPARERKFWDEKVEPVVKLQKDLYNEVRDLSIRNEIPDYEKLVEPVDVGAGYAKYLPRMIKREINADEGYDPRFNRRSPLSMWKPSTLERDWQTVVKPNGERQIYHINDEGDMVRYRDGIAVTGDILRKGKLPEDFNPRQVGSKLPDGSVVDHATVEDLIAHGRDDKGRYTKDSFELNPLMSLANSINDLSYLRARLKFIDRLRTDPEYQKHVTTSEKEAEARWGEGNVGQTILPQLKRNFYPKQVAWAFNDTVRQGFDYKGNQFMEGASRFAQSALKPFYFIGPEVHVLNELDKLLIGRGFDNLNLSKTVRNFSGALADVRAQGPMAALITEAGGNPMFLHAKLSRFVPNMARKLGVELQEKHWKLDPMFKAAGINTKAKYWEPTYQASNKMMWWQSDVLHQMVFRDNLDRHGGGNKVWEKKFAELNKLQKLEKPTAEQVTKRDELKNWQMDLARKSVQETEKIIDNYIVPTTFGKSIGLEGTDTGRAIQQALTDPAFANFGRFSHGLMKTLINIGKNMAGQNENLSPGHSAALGFSQAAMLLGMANVVYPLLSKAYSMAPWSKPESEVEKRGITSVATIPSELYHKGIKDGWAKVARRAWSPSVPINLGLTAYENRDNVGRPIMESAGPGGWAAVPFQALGHAFDQIVSPAGQVSRAYAQGGTGFAAQRFLESNFGVKTPSDAQVKYEQQRPQTEKRQGQSRERHPHGVFDIAGNKVRQLVRGYEEGGVVEPDVDQEEDDQTKQFNTPLSEDEERDFQLWRTMRTNPRDTGGDYDLRGAYKEGVIPTEDTGHFPDTYKKPNHPTFSVESKYRKYAPDRAGTWDGEDYRPGNTAEGL